MATTVDELLIKIRSDMSEFKRDLSKIQNQTQKATKSIDRSFKTMATGVKGAIGAVIAIGAVQFGRSLVTLASDVQEQTSKAKVVFGNNFGSVRDELETFGDAVGRSTSQLVNMGSSVQDTFVPMGFARDEASKLSVQLTKLAVDVASFNNASDEETMRAFQSAIVGNHETVRRFGVVITEATLKQELNRMGITKSMKEVTNAEKVQARLNLIINGTTDAHNDAINTSDSFANTTKALSSALQELGVLVMEPLIPILAKIVRGFVNAVESIKEFLSIFKTFRSSDKDLKDSNFLLEQNIKLNIELTKLRTKQLLLNKKIQDQSLSFFKKLGDALKGDAFDKESSLSILDLFRGNATSLENSLKAIEEQIAQTEAIIDANNKLIANTKQLTITRKEDAIAVEHFSKKLLPFQIKLIQGEAKTRTFLHGRQLSQIAELKQKQLLADEFEKGIQVSKLERIKEGRRVREEEAKRLKAIENELRDTSIQAFDRITDATADLLDGTTKNFDGIRSAMSMFLKDLQRTILQLTVFNKIKNQIFGTSAPTASGADIFDNIIGLFTGGGGTPQIDAFAGGGRVQKGRPTIVGERGAELFVPSTGGTIMNNMNTRGLSGGSTVVNQTINVDAGVSQTVRAEIINLLPVIKQDTISSLLEAKRRGGSFATALA
tara:strand:- start:1405 stop:3393 length:1989 start_codon:yes stop_codon:yes gene_type:complete